MAAHAPVHDGSTSRATPSGNPGSQIRTDRRPPGRPTLSRAGDFARRHLDQAGASFMSIPKLDDLASQWTDTRTLCCYPSLSNFIGGVKSSKRLGAFQNFYAVGHGASEHVSGTLY